MRRLEPLMKQRFPGGPNPLVIPRSKYADPAHLAWKGIQNLCRLDVVSDLWIRRDDWEMCVPSPANSVHSECGIDLLLFLILRTPGSTCEHSEIGASSPCHDARLPICRDSSMMLYRFAAGLQNEATSCMCKLRPKARLPPSFRLALSRPLLSGPHNPRKSPCSPQQ